VIGAVLALVLALLTGAHPDHAHDEQDKEMDSLSATSNTVRVNVRPG
jgi:hypothetical protein